MSFLFFGVLLKAISQAAIGDYVTRDFATCGDSSSTDRDQPFSSLNDI